MDEQKKCKKCGSTLSKQEIAAYGGTFCEDCLAESWRGESGYGSIVSGRARDGSEPVNMGERRFLEMD